MSDRIAGTLLAVLAIGYVVAAGNYETGYGDPLGPGAFPRMIGIPAALLAVSLLLRPGPDAHWASGRHLLRQALALATLVGYALLLEPVGFVPATIVLVGAMGLLMGASAGQAAVSGALAGPLLYLLFDRVLGLPLPLLGSWLA